MQDALQVLGGKWKLPINIALTFGAKRFKEIAHGVSGITDRMLSKELKEPEMNLLVTRTFHDTFPPKVEYALTVHGRSLQKVVDELKFWGLKNRKKIMVK